MRPTLAQPAVACIAMLSLLSACSSSSSTSRYPVAHAGVAHKLEQGTVLEANEVIIDGQATNLGMVVGGGIGAAAGAIAVPVQSTTTITPVNGGYDIHSSSNVHQSRAATALGGAVGAVVGRRVEKKLSERQAQELTIQLDSGERIVVVQEHREPAFHDGERVQVYTTGLGNSRVFHAGEDPYVDPQTNAYIPDDAEIDYGEEIIHW